MPELDAGSERRPLVSNASTLVLSVFLIAAAGIELAADDAGPYVLACGVTGVLAYAGLECARKRRERAALAAREAEVHRRLTKHLATPLAPVPLDLDRDPLAEFFGSHDPETGSRESGPQAG